MEKATSILSSLRITGLPWQENALDSHAVVPSAGCTNPSAEVYKSLVTTPGRKAPVSTLQTEPLVLNSITNANFSCLCT